VNQNRKPQGTPAGGQFAAKSQPEPGIELNAGEVDEATQWKDTEFDVTDARKWMDDGAAPKHAQAWRDAVATLRPSAAAAALEAWGPPDPYDPAPADAEYLAALRERAEEPEPVARPLVVARYADAEPDDDL